MIGTAYKLRSAWHTLMASGRRPTRRLLQQAVRMWNPTAPQTDEVNAWLRSYQRTSDDGQIYLLEPSEGAVQIRSRTLDRQKEETRVVIEIPSQYLDRPVRSRSSHDDLTAQGNLESTSPPFVSLTTETIVPTPQAEPTPIAVNVTKVEKKRRSRSKPDQETEFTYAADTSVLDDLPDADDERQPRWVRQMRTLWVPAVVDRPIGQLNADHRFALARYHAWRWANCRLDETKNRSAAMRIAAGVTNMAADKRYAALTVEQFISLGDQAWAAGGRKPMFAVWPIVGRVAVAA